MSIVRRRHPGAAIGMPVSDRRKKLDLTPNAWALARDRRPHSRVGNRHEAPAGVALVPSVETVRIIINLLLHTATGRKVHEDAPMRAAVTPSGARAPSRCGRRPC